MRLSAIATAVLAVSPAVVSAAKGIMGFALGTKRPDGSCKTQQDYADDFDAIKVQSDATIVRSYAASDCDMAKNALPAAREKGFKVILGIWPDLPTSFQRDLSAILSVTPTYSSTIYAVTIGSETLYRGNFTGAELASKIQAVRSALPPGIKCGTADSWNKFYDGAANDVIPVADILLINAFAFWQGAAAGRNATRVYFDDIYRALSHIETVAGGKDKMPEIWNGETGWPTAQGTDYGDAKGGLENAEQFFRGAFCAMLRWGVNAFYFEAIDEPWKPVSVGDNGKAADETRWGAMTAGRRAKFGLRC